MTTDDALMLECLQLANTFTEYINYAERLLNSKTIQNIKEKISNNLKVMVDKNHFDLTLENILLLFKILKTDCTDDLRNILEQSEELSSCVADKGIRLEDLNHSRHFSPAQKRQFDKIWQYVQKFRGQQPSMEILLSTA
ncbi:unnamed protein product, partial [Rotaria sp. Silwood1]